MLPFELREAIENTHGGEYCIAGGFAACPALADDVDVWLYGIDVFDGDDNGGVNEHKRVRELLEDRLRRDYGDADFEASNNETCYIGTGFVTRVGYVFVNHQKFHVLITDQPTPQALVNAFDVSTHAVAINSDGQVFRGEGWTPTMVPTVKLKDTSTTDARLKKIAVRFGHPVEDTDVAPESL
jgi:hypothetical protein